MAAYLSLADWCSAATWHSPSLSRVRLPWCSSDSSVSSEWVSGFTRPLSDLWLGSIQALLWPAVCLCVAAAFVTVVNCLSVTFAYRTQIALTFVKVFALVLIIVPGFIALGKGEKTSWFPLRIQTLRVIHDTQLLFSLFFPGQTENFQNGFEVDALTLDRLPLAFYNGLYAYGGWLVHRHMRTRPSSFIMLQLQSELCACVFSLRFYLNCVTEEVINPNRYFTFKHNFSVVHRLFWEDGRFTLWSMKWLLSTRTVRPRGFKCPSLFSLSIRISLCFCGETSFLCPLCEWCLLRNIPLAITSSMVTVTILYVLTNVAYYTMMTPAELLLSDAVAMVSDRKSNGKIWTKETNCCVLLSSVCLLLCLRRRLPTAPSRRLLLWSRSSWPCRASALSTGACSAHQGNLEAETWLLSFVCLCLGWEPGSESCSVFVLQDDVGGKQGGPMAADLLHDSHPQADAFACCDVSGEVISIHWTQKSSALSVKTQIL